MFLDVCSTQRDIIDQNMSPASTCLHHLRGRLAAEPFEFWTHFRTYGGPKTSEQSKTVTPMLSEADVSLSSFVVGAELSSLGISARMD